MSSVRRRRLAAASLAVATSLALTACGTSFSAQTNQVYQPAAGANERGDVDILNALLVSNRNGSATLSAGLVNRTADEQTISSVTATTMDGDPLEVRSNRSLVPLAPGALVSLGTESDPGGFRVAEGAEPGSYVKITFTFSETGDQTIEAPVVERSAEYAEIVGSDGLAPAEVSGEGNSAK